MSDQMKFQVQELRQEVMAIALLMEQLLRDKDADKGQSWKDAQATRLRVAMLSKAHALENSMVSSEVHVVIKHAVDLANYAMMIADVAGALESEASNGGAGWAGLDQVQMP